MDNKEEYPIKREEIERLKQEIAKNITKKNELDTVIEKN